MESDWSESVGVFCERLTGHVIDRCDERIVFGTEESLSYRAIQSVNSTSAKHYADSLQRQMTRSLEDFYNSSCKLLHILETIERSVISNMAFRQSQREKEGAVCLTL